MSSLLYVSVQFLCGSPPGNTFGSPTFITFLPKSSGDPFVNPVQYFPHPGFPSPAEFSIAPLVVHKLLLFFSHICDPAHPAFRILESPSFVLLLRFVSSSPPVRFWVELRPLQNRFFFPGRRDLPPPWSPPGLSSWKFLFHLPQVGFPSYRSLFFSFSLIFPWETGFCFWFSTILVFLWPFNT